MDGQTICEMLTAHLALVQRGADTADVRFPNWDEISARAAEAHESSIRIAAVLREHMNSPEITGAKIMAAGYAIPAQHEGIGGA